MRRWAAVCLVLVGGCHPVDAGADAATRSDAGGTVACAGFDEALAQRLRISTRSCARATHCWRDGAPSPEDACATDDLAALCDALTRGAVVYHPEHVAACDAALDACDAAVCFAPLAPQTVVPSGPACATDACDDVIALAPGTCSSNADCPSDRACIETTTCGGTCQPRPTTLGATCGDDFPCTDPYFCDRSQRMCVCSTDGCTPTTIAAAIGEPCTLDATLPMRVCSGVDGYCDVHTSHCVRRSAGGEACDAAASDASTVCVAPFTCVGSVCTAEHCDVSRGCLAGATYCAPDTYTCTADPLGALCPYDAVTRGYDTCPAGLACARDAMPGSDGRCLAVAAVGDACDASVICAPGSRCEGGHCRPLVARGTRCDTGVSACAGDDVCIEGMCGRRRVGDACAHDAECTTLHCDAGTCAWAPRGSSCAPAGPPICELGCDSIGKGYYRCGDEVSGMDEPCGFPIQCAEGLTCLSTADGHSRCRPLCAPTSVSPAWHAVSSRPLS